MAKFTVNESAVESKPGETIIAAARREGIFIPNYCWHPGLSIPANCRICLVEIKGQPRLQPACQMVPGDGWEVATENARVHEARRAVMEFLLINHPVDCPICDQAGECKLQDYWMKYDRGFSRFPDEKDKVHKPKAVPFGPLILYDAERCIACTRCVRFCDEVVKDPVLGMGNRSDHVEVILEKGRELDHAYSLMTADICPVGALTSRDFRFKQRVWFLKPSPTICPGCATGCNATLDHFRGTASRLRPRENLEVNGYWMCDEGCLTYKRVNDGRLLRAGVGQKAERREATIAEGIAWAAQALEKVTPGRLGVVLSAQHSVEDNAVLVRLAREYLETSHLFQSGRAAGEADEILRHADKNPNTAGVREAARGAEVGSFQDLLRAVERSEIDAVLALGAEAPIVDVGALARLSMLVVIASNEGPLSDVAKVVLPGASWAECTGTFVNAKGLRQRFEAAMPPRGEALPAWDVLGRLGRKMGYAFAIEKLADARAFSEAAPAEAAE